MKRCCNVHSYLSRSSTITYIHVYSTNDMQCKNNSDNHHQIWFISKMRTSKTIACIILKWVTQYLGQPKILEKFQKIRKIVELIFVISSKSLSNSIRYFEFIRSMGVKFAKFYQFGGRKCSNSVHTILITVPYTGTFNPKNIVIIKSDALESLHKI